MSDGTRDQAASRDDSLDADVLFEQLLADALRHPDPASAVSTLRDDLRLPADTRAALAHAHADGVRMAALLVARLRFERLVQGSPTGSAAFDRDPEGFVSAFRRYHAEVPPRALDAGEEDAAFAAWCAATER